MVDKATIALRNPNKLINMQYSTSVFPHF
jgi:hypothetical protein